MKQLSELFWKLFFLNLLAAYLPVLFWVLRLPQPVELVIFPYSPVAFLILLLDSPNMLISTILLVNFILLIAALSYLYRRSKTAHVIMPIGIFCLSMFQGFFFVDIILGLDAIGHT